MQKNTEFLQQAQKIGIKICNDAFWHNSQCSWLGRSIVEVQNKAYQKPMVTSLGIDIYGGTSGIGLFLSHLYKITKNTMFKKTAVGAIRHALDHATQTAAKNRLGFYAGLTGVAYSSITIGDNLNLRSLTDEGMDLAQGLMDKKQNNSFFDIIGGHAGAILGLLKIFQFSKDPKFLKFAILLGKHLIQNSVKTDYGQSWDSRANGISNTAHNLTGYAHGAAGIGHSLMELYFATKDQEFLSTAENAFRYENHWFDKARGNWPDFRNQSTSNPKYATAWCHGAPGIGLSRIEACKKINNQRYFYDCEVAASTTIDYLKKRTILGDFSLCHGIFGLCDILLELKEIVDHNESMTVIHDMAKRGMQMYGDNCMWPCGISSGITPNLMLGLAGIGYFYMRLYDSKIPSVLHITSG